MLAPAALPPASSSPTLVAIHPAIARRGLAISEQLHRARQGAAAPTSSTRAISFLSFLSHFRVRFPEELLAWAATCPLASAWAACPRADWLLRVACAIFVSSDDLIRAACAICRHLLPPGDTDQRHLRRLLGMLEDWHEHRGEIARECGGVELDELRGIERAVYALALATQDEASVYIYLDEVAYWAAYELSVRRAEEALPRPDDAVDLTFGMVRYRAAYRDAVKRGALPDEDGDIDWNGARFMSALHELAGVVRSPALGGLTWTAVTAHQGGLVGHRAAGQVSA